MNKQNSNPFVSVIMPVYNQEYYVSQAVTSILQQTFRDFEFIVVDDGSTDRTVELLKNVSDCRLRIVQAKHSGFRQALQRGYSEARGELIARMDSDDYSSPHRLERCVAFMRSRSDCVLVGSSYGYITVNERFVSPVGRAECRAVTARAITLGKRWFADPSAMFKRAVAEKVGWLDPEFENELPLWYKLLAEGPCMELGECLFFARWVLGSHSRSRLGELGGINSAIRRKYDPINFKEVPAAGPFNPRRAAATKAKKGFAVCLAARDVKEARRMAWRVVKLQPLTLSSYRMLFMAVIGSSEDRLWPDATSRVTDGIPASV